MKKTTAHIITALLALIVTISGYYPDAGRIHSFDYATDTVYVMTSDGNLWNFAGIEDWTIGDMCGIMFHDNDTPNWIYDDVIVRLKYAQQIENFWIPEDDYILIEEPFIIEEPDLVPEEIILDLPELFEIEF